MQTSSLPSGHASVHAVAAANVVPQKQSLQPGVGGGVGTGGVGAGGGGGGVGGAGGGVGVHTCE